MFGEVNIFIAGRGLKCSCIKCFMINYEQHFRNITVELASKIRDIGAKKFKLNLNTILKFTSQDEYRTCSFIKF